MILKVFSRPRFSSRTMTLYGSVEERIRTFKLPHDFPVPCNYLKRARGNICLCGVNQVTCFQFCKCESAKCCRNPDNTRSSTWSSNTHELISVIMFSFVHKFFPLQAKGLRELLTPLAVMNKHKASFKMDLHLRHFWLHTLIIYCTDLLAMSTACESWNKLYSQNVTTLTLKFIEMDIRLY